MASPGKTPSAPLWYEVVADGVSYHYESREEAEADKQAFVGKGAKVDSEIYRDSCLPAGDYFVGDPSLVLKDWDAKKGFKYPLESAVYLLNDETYFAIYKAQNGPGSYYDEEGNVYSTKSGYIAFLPIYDAESGLDAVIDLDMCEVLAEDGEAHIYEFEGPVDTQIDRQCEGAIDFGGYPFIFTGDECWYEGE